MSMSAFRVSRCRTDQFVCCSSATITLTIRNSGPDAIDPEKYGDEITIRRRLYASGNASQWKVWGGNKPIPDARKAVVEICDLYNIQVDNPMTVLTQDQSRAFLSDAEPRKKYDVSHGCFRLLPNSLCQYTLADVHAMHATRPDRQRNRSLQRKYQGQSRHAG